MVVERDRRAEADAHGCRLHATEYKPGNGIDTGRRGLSWRWKLIMSRGGIVSNALKPVLPVQMNRKGRAASRNEGFMYDKRWWGKQE